MSGAAVSPTPWRVRTHSPPRNLSLRAFLSTTQSSRTFLSRSQEWDVGPHVAPRAHLCTVHAWGGAAGEELCWKANGLYFH